MGMTDEHAMLGLLSLMSFFVQQSEQHVTVLNHVVHSSFPGAGIEARI
jgi:hypothetical protein